MRFQWMRGFLRAPDGEGGGAQGAEGTEGGSASGGESLLDGAKPADGKQGESAGGGKDTPPRAESAYRPDGLSDNLIGTSDRDTIDRMAKALKGFQADASRAGKSGKVPDAPDGYRVAPTGDDDAIGKALGEERFAPVLTAAREAALAAGMGDAQFDKFIRAYAEKGFDPSEFMSDDDAAKVSYETERAALNEIYGDPSVAQGVMDFVAGKLTWFQNSGVLSDADMAEARVMVGTAEGMSVMHKMITVLTGEQAVPVHLDGEGSTSSRRDAQARMNAALSMPRGPERDAAIAEAEQLFAKVFGSHDAGTSVKVA